MSARSPYESFLDANPANYVPLTPLSFLERTAGVFPNRLAWIHGDRRATYREFRERCLRLASALVKRGIGKNDTVSIMAS
ncbi:MAG: AMP-binding protein, partial [Planctomycetaceae bacterium]|nr:AMP-binding protein [Planctomycetaceae bacterium]